jgi:hypothetical protein
MAEMGKTEFSSTSRTTANIYRFAGAVITRKFFFSFLFFSFLFFSSHLIIAIWRDVISSLGFPLNSRNFRLDWTGLAHSFLDCTRLTHSFLDWTSAYTLHPGLDLQSFALDQPRLPCEDDLIA